MEINQLRSTAEEELDYILLRNKTVTFLPGTNSSVAVVRILNDAEPESSEVFLLEMKSNNKNVIIGKNNIAIIKIDDKEDRGMKYFCVCLRGIF